MANLDLLMKAMDTAVWELGEGFTGLPDEDVWVRPHPNLLSIGELAVHMVGGEADWMGVSLDSTNLVHQSARYYPYNVKEPFTLPLGAAQVYDELKGFHERVKAHWLANPKDSEDNNPVREGLTWGQTLEYMAFHFAYHCGQIYSVRHLMGHETVDN